jgi:hypothetical protein
MVELLELHVEKEYEYSLSSNKLKYILDEIGRLNTANTYYGLVSYSFCNFCPQM